MSSHSALPSEPFRLDFAGLRVLFVMALDAEYGPHLRSLMTPLFIGVGPIEAVLHTALALQTLAGGDGLPDLVVSLGSAGSQTLTQGEIYQVSSVSWRDIDGSPIGFPKGLTPFLDLPAEVPLPTPLANIAAARLSSGAAFISGDGYAAIDAEMVDMETFSVMRACHRFSVPMLGLRGISDGAEELRRYSDWAKLLPVLDEKLADTLGRLETLLRAEGLNALKG
ncbi:MAG: 5'-methylthioadenosine/S-adenosylhomocysteine nucleosidase [Methylobacteriaceae bacterium]|jgi:adenosylhomocysteine nucleosidase|nr:5'-methylthioadenosine/S-adenosylhomocysteine nucleosidase [Methylobacteriaceae bacterium]